MIITICCITSVVSNISIIIIIVSIMIHIIIITIIILTTIVNYREFLTLLFPQYKAE